MRLGLVHAVVDATSCAILYYEANDGRLTYDRICRLILLYNCIAFGLQLPLGLLADRFRAYKSAAIAGLGGIALALGLMTRQPQLAVVVVAVGNALFHVGASAIVLSCSGGRAGPAGVFVAPGAFGVALGIWLGTGGLPFRWCMELVVVASGLLLFLHRSPSTRLPVIPAPPKAWLLLGAGAGLLCLVIMARSLIGDTVSGCWRSSWTMGLALTAVAVSGKALGGIMADRLGWRAWGVAALALAALFIGWAAANAPVALLALFLIHTTTAVTLAAVFVCFRTRPGAAFGLCSGALLAGAMPGLTGIFPAYDPKPLLAPLAGLAALALFLGLGCAAKLHVKSRPG